NGEIMTGSLDHPDLISSPHITLDDDAQVSPGPQRVDEAARKQLIIHPDSKPPARDSRLRNLKHGGSDVPTLSDERIVRLNPFNREIFAELTVCKRSADLLLPPPCVFDGVCVDRFIGSTMRFSVRLGVSV